MKRRECLEAKTIHKPKYSFIINLNPILPIPFHPFPSLPFPLLPLLPLLLFLFLFLFTPVSNPSHYPHDARVSMPRDANSTLHDHTNGCPLRLGPWTSLAVTLDATSLSIFRPRNSLASKPGDSGSKPCASLLTRTSPPARRSQATPKPVTTPVQPHPEPYQIRQGCY